MTKRKHVLISGASIAGPALAHWLDRHGFRVTVVEKSPTLRAGGQAIDVRGAALDVLDRMGLLAEARAGHTAMRGMSFVDGDGAVLFESTEMTLTGGAVDNPDIEILRDDLARLLYASTKDGVEYLFGDSIVSLAEDADGVTVTFDGGATRRFDLVVGADGVHSRTRRLAFGPEQAYLRPLGMYLSVFTTENFLGLDSWQTFHRRDDGMAGLYSARNNTEARAILGFMTDAPPVDHRDPDAQRELLAEYFGDWGWVTSRLLDAMWHAPDFYCDRLAQIRMDAWSSGRVVLLGDAAYCGSPMSGQGTSLALIGAYVLAGELAAAGGDHRAGFAAYEAELRDFVVENQDFGLRNFAAGRPAEPEETSRIAGAYALKRY